MTYLYDGTYEGFLSAVFRIFEDKAQQTAHLATRETAGLLPFQEETEVLANALHADRVSARLEALHIASNVYYAFLYAADTSGGDTANAILAYIRLALTMKGNPDEMRYDPAVDSVLKAARFVSREVGRFVQFARFVKAGQSAAGRGVYVADIAPAYDILPLLIGHFTQRLNDQCFFLRDTNRKYALVWDTENWQLSSLPEINDPPLPKDGVFEALWRKYFDNVAIPWRKNPKLQQHFIPLRYRKDMTEFQK